MFTYLVEAVLIINCPVFSVLSIDAEKQSINFQVSQTWQRNSKPALPTLPLNWGKSDKFLAEPTIFDVASKKLRIKN